MIPTDRPGSALPAPRGIWPQMRRDFAGRWDVSHSLALAGLVAPGLAMWAPLGMAPLLVVVAVAALGFGWRDRIWRRFPQKIGLILAGLCLWAGLSALWAVDPRQSLFSAAQLALTTFAGMVVVASAQGLDATAARRIGLAVTVGVMIGLALFALGLATGARLTAFSHGLQTGDFTAYRLSTQRFNRGATVTLLLAVPALVGLRRFPVGIARSVLAAPCLALALVVKALAAKALVLCGLIALILFRTPSRRAGAALGAVLVALVVLVPAAAHLLPPPQVTIGWSLVPYSSHHRLTIWGFTAARIWERPLLGWGMDSARSIPGGEDEVVVRLENPRGSGNMSELSEQVMPLHPHNAILQWWLELGAVGAGLFALLLWRLAGLAVAGTPPPHSRVAAASLLLGCLVVSVVSFGFWQSWWQSSMWMLTAWLIAVTASVSPKPPSDESVP
ncbi:Lipid A core-O-antigen ligase and related enzyme [Candidatus Terasakiella magnetica]|nr:Lipid A core-O-antigen ligase and related enzyme [Candidatus Terasakiella magnetica]